MHHAVSMRACFYPILIIYMYQNSCVFDNITLKKMKTPFCTISRKRLVIKFLTAASSKDPEAP